MMDRIASTIRARQFLLAAGLAICAGAALAAKPDPDYERLRDNLNQLKSDRALGALAPAEIALAEQALAQLAQQGGGQGKEHDHFLYIAQQRVDTARAAAQAVEQERKLDALDREHDQILLAASRRDAEQARLELEKQRVQSLVQAEDAERLRAEADEARQQNEEVAKQLETSKKQAAQARRLAEAQAKDAELARKEAALLASSAPAATAKAAAPVVLGEEVFAPGQADLKPAATAQIARIAASASGKTVRVEARADGNTEANLALALRRAKAVRDALVAAGVPAGSISATGVGAKAGGARGVTISFADH